MFKLEIFSNLEYTIEEEIPKVIVAVFTFSKDVLVIDTEDIVILLQILSLLLTKATVVSDKEGHLNISESVIVVSVTLIVLVISLKELLVKLYPAPEFTKYIPPARFSNEHDVMV